MNTYDNELGEGERVYITLPNGDVLAIDYLGQVATVHIKLATGKTYNVQITEEAPVPNLFTGY